MPMDRTFRERKKIAKRKPYLKNSPANNHNLFGNGASIYIVNLISIKSRCYFTKLNFFSHCNFRESQKSKKRK